MAAPRSWIRPLPNVLTTLRIAAAAALPLVAPAGRLPLVVFAGVSDWLDGLIARRFGAESRAGALLDGVADKLFVASAIGTFLAAGEIRVWEGLLVLSRDLAVGAIAAVAALRRAWHAFAHMRARPAGKLTTALVLPWFLALLLPALAPVRDPLFAVAALASVVAALDYVRETLRVRHALEHRDAAGSDEGARV